MEHRELLFFQDKYRNPGHAASTVHSGRGVFHVQLCEEPQIHCNSGIALSECSGMAKAAGAEIDLEIGDMGYGGRAFTCRDPEGHLCCVGSHDPWAPAASA